jgi:phosphoenolpyruvate phosphomutase
MLMLKLLRKPGLTFFMEAHSGISAKIAKEAGHEALWASGLSMSASRGVRDANELSWTQVVDACDEMVQASGGLPMLVDGDTGYGNFNNARRFVAACEQRGVAGVCMEDKLFPKQNSFVAGESQKLADAKEFGLKIRACVDVKKSNDFAVVARLESFITGFGLEDALQRATIYEDNGADAILCHSKKETAEDIEAFMANWKGNVPVIIVPTTYIDTPVSHFENLGVSGVIWANHQLRSSTLAMQQVCQDLAQNHSIKDSPMVSVKEIFRLQEQDKLNEDEKKYE